MNNTAELSESVYQINQTRTKAAVWFVRCFSSSCSCLSSDVVFAAGQLEYSPACRASCGSDALRRPGRPTRLWSSRSGFAYLSREIEYL